MKLESISFTSDPYVICPAHGRRPSATLCFHLAHDGGRGFYQSGFDDTEDAPLAALCMFCAMIDVEGTGWTDHDLASDNLRTVCDRCFELAQARSLEGDDPDNLDLH